MALQATILTLTPEWNEKRLSVVGGSPAVHEKVKLTLTGAATDESGVPSELVVRVFSAGGSACGVPAWHPLADTMPDAVAEFARFPLTDTDEWAVSGSDLTCTLNLNTAVLGAVFAERSYDASVDAVIVVESGAEDNLYAVGRLRIRNWVINTDDPVLGSSVLKSRVDDLETAMETEESTREAADTAETDARLAGDSALGVRIDGCASSGALAQEVADRAAADISEASARSAADSVLNNAIADKATSAALSAEVGARQAAVAAEANTREDGDTALTLAVAGKASATDLQAEITARGVADSVESEARTLADDALGAAIALKQTSPSASALAALAAIDALPEEFTEITLRTWVNAVLSALRGLYE